MNSGHEKRRRKTKNEQERLHFSLLITYFDNLTAAKVSQGYKNYELVENLSPSLLAIIIHLFYLYLFQ